MVYYGLMDRLSNYFRNMNTARIIIAGIVALIAASIIIGAILLLGGLFPKKPNPEEPLANLPVVNVSISPEPTSSLGTITPTKTVTPTPAGSGSTNRGNTLDSRLGNLKTYSGEGFSLRYPSDWGLLTCGNSNHFEFDPTSAQDVAGVVCDYAVKPITVLVKDGNISCSGDKVTLGSRSVTKSLKTYSDGDKDYRWCVNEGGKTLDITHRVSQSGSRATSKTDYSSQVEDMIADYQITSGS